MRMELRLPGRVVPVEVHNHLFDRMGRKIREVYGGEDVFLLTDANLEPRFRQRLETSLAESGLVPVFHVIGPGEGSKTLEGAGRAYAALLAHGFTRQDLLLVVGGGVPGDLGGFVAATYLRGIPYVQVATSLLAQVDSSIGGKVGVNLPEGKNLCGSFYHPELVLIDPGVLHTLPRAEWQSGMAEVIKYGCIGDPGLLELVRAGPLHRNGDPERLREIIGRCVAQKIRIVSMDEKESGRRALLNFGHTLGHALEQVLGYGTLSHGEAVAIGMARFTERSEALGLTRPGTAAALREILEETGLSADLPAVSRADLLAAMERDKKGKKDTVRIILLKHLGQAGIHEIPRRELGSFF